MRKVIVTALAGIAALVALTAVTAGASPRAVNGQIAYDRVAGTEQFVYTANPDGSHEHQLIPGQTCCPGWSKDGSKLTIARLTDDGRIGTAAVNADGSGYTPLPIDDPTLNLGCPVWSPDGTRLACEGWDESNPGRGGIYTISSSNGSGLTRLTNPLAGGDQPGAYSPDGKRLVFLRLDQDGNSLGLFVLKVNDGKLRQITPPGTLIQIGNPGDWSPQGNEIVFARRITADMRTTLWVVHSDGSGLRQIHVEGLGCGGPISDPTARGCFQPRWSPDGTKIVFTIFTAAAGRDIYTVNPDGTGLTPITSGGLSSSPDWGTHPLAQ
jgi:Tol biopolymer transport system component